MSTVRLLPAFLLIVFLGGEVLFLSDRAHAYCTCGQTCPQRSCGCDPNCPHLDSFQTNASDNIAFQIRSFRITAQFMTDAAGNDLPTGRNLLGMTQGFVRLQCQRLTEMLNWASDTHIKGPEFQLTLQ